MDEIQKKYYTLLCELDEICRANDITYYLSNKTALCAYVKREMPDANTNPSIMIAVKDCRRFMKAIENKKQPERLLESMDNNSRYPLFQLKYTDTESLCLSVRQYRNYRVHGISVYIGLIESTPGKYLKKIGTALKLGWRENTIPYSSTKSISKKGRVSKYIVKPFYVLNKKWTAKCIFRILLKIYGQPGKKFQIRKNDGSSRNIPKICMCSKPRNIRIEDHDFLIPGETEVYLQALFGTGYRNPKKFSGEPNKYRIIDAGIPYAKYMEYNKSFFQSVSFEKMICENNRLNRWNKKNNDVINRAWSLGLYVGEKLRLKRKYSEKKEKILNLYQNCAWKELEIELADYIKQLNVFLKNGWLLYIDDEIFDITLEILKRTNNSKYIEKLKMLAVPYKK